MDFGLKIALRDSIHATRPYLIVNPILAKHLPVQPSNSLDVFYQLGKKVAAALYGEKVLVIGFAETATAVGAAVASMIKDAVYVHTTRHLSDLQLEDLVVDFLEEHSHAKNQSLYLRDTLKDLSKYDRLVFVEDEVTTGKTIYNFLKNISFQGKIAVAALVFNGFDEARFDEFQAKCFCLQKIGYINQMEVSGLLDTRLGVDGGVYKNACDLCAKNIIENINIDFVDKSVLVLGTEEFMYPALVLGKEIEKITKDVVSHSTTRSPILALEKNGYPIYSKVEFKSVYDTERKTYLYNLKSYDVVILMTNATDLVLDELWVALQSSGNHNLYVVRVLNEKT